MVKRPTNILLLLGGSVVVTTGYLTAMYFAIQAFGGDLSFAQVGAVYLVGSAVGERRAHTRAGSARSRPR